MLHTLALHWPKWFLVAGTFLILAIILVFLTQKKMMSEFMKEDLRPIESTLRDSIEGYWKRNLLAIICALCSGFSSVLGVIGLIADFLGK